MTKTLLLLALALVACGGKKDKPAEGADPVDKTAGGGGGGESGPSFDCSKLLTADEIQSACGATGSLEKLATEGETDTVGTSKMKHVCYRDIKVGANGTVKLVVNFVSGELSAEEVVRTTMDLAGQVGWAKKVNGMTGYVGSPPAPEGETPTLELTGLARGTMMKLTTKRGDTGWACEEAGLVQLAKLLAERVPAAPSRE
jgi:hypothetical protein